MIHLLRAAMLAAAISSLAFGANFSFTGTFGQDDDVQIFDFSVGSASNITLRSYSYAGGTNAAGTVISRGGFDPILALFDASGNLIDSQDDAGCPDVPADAVTGDCYDVLLTKAVAAGNYRVAVMQYDNFPAGNTLAQGFSRQGQGNFTGAAFADQPGGSFIDVNPNQRTNQWAFDILNVSSATQVPDGEPPTTVPEPSTMALAGIGLAIAVALKRK